MEAYMTEVLRADAFELSKRAALKDLSDQEKTLQDRLRTAQQTLVESKREADWAHYGDLLKATLPNAPKVIGGVRKVQDWMTGLDVELPSEKGLTASQEVERFYTLAKRKARRLKEATGRIETAREALEALQKKKQELEKVEELETPETKIASKKSPRKSQDKTSGTGRMYTSTDGLRIHVGRSRDENSKLTFGLARGNDVWMHIRGRPGAHVIIQTIGTKSAPLETLLDAASLAIFHSGGEDWGKTEVDYTFKKFVKRIKDSTEVSYTQNKTLIVQMDQVRLRRLREQT